MQGLTSEEEKTVELAIQAIEIMTKFEEKLRYYHELIEYMSPEKQRTIFEHIRDRLGYFPFENKTMVV